MKEQVNNLNEFMEKRGFGEKTIHDIQNNTYKYTYCGAWFHYDKPLDDPTEGRVIVGSIVEGSDYGTEQYTLEFPFTLGEFWDALENVEIEASNIWTEVNGEEVWQEKNFMNG